MEEFITAIENSPELQEKITTVISCEDIVNIAIAAGYHLTVEELQTTLITSFDELVLQLDNVPGISSDYARVFRSQLFDSICFSS